MPLLVSTSWRSRSTNEAGVAQAGEAEVRKAARSLSRKFSADAEHHLDNIGILDTSCGDGKLLEKAIVWIEEELTHPDTDAAHLRLSIAVNCIYGLAADSSACEVTRYRLYDLCERTYLPRDFLHHRVIVGHGIFDVSGRLLRRLPVSKRPVSERIRIVIGTIEDAASKVLIEATRELQRASNYHQRGVKARARARMWSALEPLRMIYKLHVAGAMQNMSDADHYYSHALEIAARDVRAFVRDCRHGGAAAFIDQAAGMVSVPHEFPFMGSGVPSEKDLESAAEAADAR